ncbi:MAG: hypothetical protein IKC32_03115 [Clostridia bacterium]|nr:hypothetical protein [Clostridia bacterium]
MKLKEFNKSLPEIERLIGYSFRDKSLIRQAFTRSSWCNEQMGEHPQSNEVLEFFGDSVLSLSIVSFLLSSLTERCAAGLRTELGEGDFSNIKSKLSDKTNLSLSTKKLGLEKYLLVGEGDAKLGIENEPSVMEDLFESIVGAVYIDTGMDVPTVMRVVSGMLDMSVYTRGDAPSVSPKNALQEWCADKRRRLPPPIYKTLSESGPDHKKLYERGVYIGERLLARAEGKNLKIADSLAAEAALKLLKGEDVQSEESDKGEPTERAAKEKTPKNGKATAVDKPSQPKTKERASKPTDGTKKPVKPTAKSEEAKSTKPTKAAKSEEAKPTKPAKAAKKPAVKAEPTKPTAKAKSTEASKPTAKTTNKEASKPVAKAALPLGRRAKKQKPAEVGESAAARLKRRSAELMVATPAFRDLGEVRAEGGGRAYRVECSFGGRRISADAPSRLEAKEKAAALMLKATEGKAR